MKRLLYLCSFACLFLSGCRWPFTQREEVATEEEMQEVQDSQHTMDEEAESTK